MAASMRSAASPKAQGTRLRDEAHQLRELARLLAGLHLEDVQARVVVAKLGAHNCQYFTQASDAVTAHLTCCVFSCTHLQLKLICIAFWVTLDVPLHSMYSSQKQP